MKRYLPFAIILIVLLGAIGAGVLLFQAHKPPPPPVKPVFGIPGAEPPHVRGPANAPVELEEFGDFECLPCFKLWPALKNLEKDYPESLSITFRQHPLALHRYAMEAARAAEAAGLQDHFWEMYDMLYLRRSEWVRVDNARIYFTRCALDLGLDIERFAKDLDSEEVAKRIAADQSRGDSLGIDRTPVVFINGKKIEFTPEPEEGLRKEIDAALGKKAPE